MSLVKSKKRVKDFGEVYTPSDTVTQMIDRFEDSVWASETFLEPACGNGNMIVAIVAKKMASGLSPLVALSTTYGVDILHDNVEECQLRLQHMIMDLLDKNEFFEACKIISNNIRVGNTLTQALDEIFIPLPGAQNVMQVYED